MFDLLPWEIQKIILSFEYNEDIHKELEKKLFLKKLVGIDYVMDKSTIYVSDERVFIYIFDSFTDDYWFQENCTYIGYEYISYRIQIVDRLIFTLYRKVSNLIFRRNIIECHDLTYEKAKQVIYATEEFWENYSIFSRDDGQFFYELELYNNRILRIFL